MKVFTVDGGDNVCGQAAVDHRGLRSHVRMALQTDCLSHKQESCPALWWLWLSDKEMRQGITND